MTARKHAISILGDEFKRCSNIELAESLIAGNFVPTPRFKLLTKKRATRLINNLYKRINKKPAKKKSTYKIKSTKFLQSWEWRTLRYEVLNKFGRRCMCCGATPDDGMTVIHVDHIKPRHKYPQLSLVADNLQILCGVCNQGKGAWDETDFRHCIEDENERLEREWQNDLVNGAKLYQ